MELQQPLCYPNTFDFGLPMDFLTEDQDTLEMAALSEDLFSSADCELPDFDVLPAIRFEVPSDKNVPEFMVPLDTLFLPPHAQHYDSCGTSASPASSGTSYTPASEAAASPSDKCLEALSDSPLQFARRSIREAKVDVRIGKRKPDVDLDTIPDIQERRKQRRLAKNRATAATSRARKREQMSHLAVRVAELEEQNAVLSKALALRTQELAEVTSTLRPL